MGKDNLSTRHENQFRIIKFMTRYVGIKEIFVCMTVFVISAAIGYMDIIGMGDLGLVESMQSTVVASNGENVETTEACLTKKMNDWNVAGKKERKAIQHEVVVKYETIVIAGSMDPKLADFYRMCLEEELNEVTEE